MPRLTAPAIVLFLTIVTVFSYGLRLRMNPLPVPLYMILTIVFITSGSIIVSFLALRAYLKERRPSILFVGSGSLVFGLTSMVAGFAAVTAGLNGSNPATTIFVVGACLSSASHLMGVGLRPIGTKRRPGGAPVVILTLAAVLGLTLIVIVAAFEGWFPTFLIPGEGITPVAMGLLAVAITALGLASFLIVVSSSMSVVLYWYTYALATTAVGLLGTLLSNWIFEAPDFLVGRTTLCLAGAFMVMSVKSAEKNAIVDSDAVLEELFKPLSAV